MPAEEMFSRKATLVLVKYIEPAVIDSDEDDIILDRYSGIGFVGFHSLDLDHLDPDCYEKGTAGLTLSGLKHLEKHLCEQTNTNLGILSELRYLIKISKRIKKLKSLEWHHFELVSIFLFDKDFRSDRVEKKEAQ